MIEKLNFDSETLQAMKSAYSRRPAFYETAAKRAYQGEAPDYPITKSPPIERLVILGCCVKDIWKKYDDLGIPEETIRNTLSDIPLRARLYRKKTGRPGLSKEDVIWFRHLWLCEIFQLGSLQYQPFFMLYLDQESIGEPYMTYAPEQKQKLPQGDPVINVHIPEGADLSAEAVNASFCAARGFFPAFLPEHKAAYFICYSWLLYPGLGDLLPEESNIRRFAVLFEVVGMAPDPADSLRRIYGRRYPRKSDYPCNTSLQRNTLGRFSSLGEACGILPMTKGGPDHGNPV